MARIANRYAKALYQLVGSDLAKAKELRDSFDGINQLFEMKDAGSVLRSPVMPPDLKKSLLDYGLEKSGASDEVRQLCRALLEAGRVQILPDVAKAFIELLDNAEGIARAEVVSAVALKPDDTQAIAESLGKLLGKKVEIKPEIDPSLLGGFLVRAGNYRVDMSLKTRLDGLSKRAVQDSLR